MVATMSTGMDPGGDPGGESPAFLPPVPERTTNSWATASLLLAGLTWLVSIFAAMGVVAGMVAGVVVMAVCALGGLVTGLVGLFQATGDPEQKGSGRALWGIILSCPPIGVALMLWEFLRTPFPSKGRPLRVGGRVIVARPKIGGGSGGGGDWNTPDPNSLDVQPVRASLAAVLADCWTADALAEHASVASFASLSLRLMAVGAGSELIQRCHLAALDEIKHARASFAVASAYAGQARGAGVLPLPTSRLPAAGATADDELVRLAVESFDDGAVGESYAAAAAALGATTARDPALVSLLAAIADDERRHADLGWDIIDFCLDRAPHVVGPALGARCQRPPRWPAVSERLAEPDGGEAHGRVAYARRRALFEEATTAAVARLGASMTRGCAVVQQGAFDRDQGKLTACGMRQSRG